VISLQQKENLELAEIFSKFYVFKELKNGYSIYEYKRPL
jgi:hypothetical protein